jgi:putative hemolysin
MIAANEPGIIEEAVAAAIGSPWELLLWGTLWVVTLIASAICSGTETGCYTLNRVRLDLRARRMPPDVPARLIRAELERPERLVATLLIANNIVGFLSAEAMQKFLSPFPMGDASRALLNTVIIAPSLFIMGEALPKELFRIRADKITYFFARPLWAFRTALSASGILGLILLTPRLVEKVAGLPAASLGDARQRIAALLKEGAAHGVLSESQLTLVDRALAFRGVTVGDELTPWSRVRSLPVNAEIAFAKKLLGGLKYSRFPVTDAGGRVVGVVRHADLHLRKEAKRVGDLLVPHVRLRSTTPAPEALRLLHSANSRMGIVEDANGRPVGVVTAKDLVEPLIGQFGGRESESRGA